MAAALEAEAVTVAVEDGAGASRTPVAQVEFSGHVALVQLSEPGRHAHIQKERWLMSANLLQQGDRVYHPMYGFGVVESLTARDQADYYGIRLSDGTVLSVPVARAEGLGLRPIANSLTTVVAGLRSTARPLPNDDRERAIQLKARWQAPQPTALTQAVRDLLGRSRTSHLTPADKRWLTSACERLSTEVALVDGIDLTQARAAIQQEIDRFKLKVSVLQPTA